MADIICRWRNGTPKNVMELVNSLPHKKMKATEFRSIMSSKWKGNFFTSPYQLACQLGLYYESDDDFFILALIMILTRMKHTNISSIGFQDIMFQTHMLESMFLKIFNVQLLF